VGAAGGDRAERFIEALGGAANLSEVEACTTRLRLVLVRRDRVDARALASLGSRGSVEIGESGLQVVVGPIADQVAAEMRARLVSVAPSDSPAAIAAALGGAANIATMEPVGGRLLVTVTDPERIDEAALGAACARGVARPAPASVHLLHPDPGALRSELAALRA
jgi:PTS system N-acetylglucosamine-specific IIC component